MNRLLRAAALALPLVAAVIAACSSDDAASADTFSIALTIAGQGSVVTAPTGLDCAGPRDCGSRDYAAGTVTITATPASGYTLSKIEVNDVTTTDPVVRGAAGATEKVIVTFAPTGTGADASAAGADAGCDAPDACGAGEVCCIRARSTAEGFVPTGSACESADACRRNDDQGQAGYPMCAPPTDTRCTPVESCIASSQGSSTYVCVLPTL